MNPDSVGRRAQKILVLDSSEGQSTPSAAVLRTELPYAQVVSVSSIDEFVGALSEGPVDILVIDYDLPAARDVMFLRETQIDDDAPGILLVSKCADLEVMRAIADANHRYVVRDETFSRSMAHAVRDLLRARRDEESNIQLRARLTEMNYLLEEKNRRLDEFCATVAHDIRGPLAGLILKVDYILDQHGSEFTDRCSKLLNRSLDSAQRLVGIVQAMYEFAKVGSSASNAGTVDLKALVLDVLADLNLDESRDVSVGVDELPTIWGSAPLIRRIFINLLNNALKYNDKEKILLNVGYSGIEERCIGRFATIFVEDNGPGIPEDEARTIFNMFARGSSGTGRNPDGLGVGLAVVQRVIELHLGTILLSSQPGLGCKFSFTLPLEKISLAGDEP